MQTINSLTLDTSLGLARAIALFDGLRIADSRPMSAQQESGLADALIKEYMPRATDKIARHLSARGVVFPNATELEPEDVAEDVAEVMDISDDEIAAQAERASAESPLELGEE